jgi:leader peptidase (prepilin peptidase)/N-methyltransferase
MAGGLPLLLHPGAGLLGLLLGLPAGGFLATCADRFAYDDETFDPDKGPRGRDHYWVEEFEDLSFLPWHHRIPFFGYLVGMVQFCHFSLLLAPPACVDCHRQLPLGERIPVLSYLWLGGKCRGCAAPIPGQHLWIEAATPLLFFVVLALHGPTLEGFLYLFLVGICLLASVVDWNYQIIPDEVPTAALAVGLGVGLGHTLVALTRTGWPATGSLQDLLLTPALADPLHLGWVLAGGLAGGLTLWTLQVIGSWLARTTAMGGGDVKLASALGLYVGFWGVLIGLFYAALLGAASGILVMLTRGGKREQGFTKFAFGPYICLGVLLVVLVGEELALELYLACSRGLFLALTGSELAPP